MVKEHYRKTESGTRTETQVVETKEWVGRHLGTRSTPRSESGICDGHKARAQRTRGSEYAQTRSRIALYDAHEIGNAYVVRPTCPREKRHTQHHDVIGVPQFKLVDRKG